MICLLNALDCEIYLKIQKSSIELFENSSQGKIFMIL